MLQILCFLSLSAFSNCNNNKVFLTYSNESSGDMNSYISYQSVTYVSKLYAEKSGINPGIGNGGNSAFICSDIPRQKHDITEFYKWNFCSKYKQNTAETTFGCHSRSSKWHITLHYINNYLKCSKSTGTTRTLYEIRGNVEVQSWGKTIGKQMGF